MNKPSSGPLDRLTKGLKGIFRRKTPPEPGAIPKPTSSPTLNLTLADATSPSEKPVDARLARALKGRSVVSAGRLQLVGLSQLRKKLGPRWERYKTTVYNVADRTLERRLTDKDVFVRHDEENYLVVFAELTGAEGHAKAAIIAQEIEKALVGENATSSGMTSVKSFTIDVNGDLIVDNIDLQQTLNDMLTLAEEYQDLEAFEDFNLSNKDMVYIEHDESESYIATPITANKQSMDAKWRPITTRSVNFEGLPVQFWPVWDVRRSVALAFLMEPVVGEDELEALESPLADPETCLGIDLHLLHSGIEHMQALLERQRRLLIIVPVHFETLANRRRNAIYAEAFWQLSQDLRDLMTLEIQAIPSGTLEFRLQDIAISCRNFARDIYCRIDMATTRPELLEFTGLKAVGAHLARSSADSLVQMHQVSAFAGSIARTRLNSFVHGADTLSQATNAVCAGIDYISGQAVHRPLDRIDAAYRFKPEDLLAPLLTRYAD